MITQKQVEDALYAVQDPELQMSIVDLGLVYKITTSEKQTHILMTLTSMGCPLFDTIEDDIYHSLGKIGIPKEKIKIELTFDPPWSMDRMSERAKAMLGI